MEQCIICVDRSMPLVSGLTGPFCKCKSPCGNENCRHQRK